MSTPDEIAKPLLREEWKAVKKAAGVKAKAKKQEAQYNTFAKQFDLDLGPTIKKWPGWYPDLGKMRSERVKIDLIIKKYEKFVETAKRSKTLPIEVTKILSAGLTDLSESLDTRTGVANSLLMSNEDLQLSQAIKASKKTPLKPVTVFSHPDLSREIMNAAPKAAPFVTVNKLQIEVLLTDDSILSSVDDADGNMSAKIKDVGDFAKLKADIVKAYVTAAVAVKADPNAFAAANSKFETAIDAAVTAAAGRASQEMHRLVGIKVEYRNYKIKSTVKLVMAVAGTAAGAASIAMAPFTGPAVVISALGVLKGAKVIGDQLADLTMSADELLRELQADVKGLNSRYKEWKGAGIGTAEVASTLVNAIAPTIFPTIKRCASHADTIVSKINGIETKAGAFSVELNKTLDAQTVAGQAIQKWIVGNKSAVTGDVQKAAVKLMTAMKKNRAEVTNLIAKIAKMNSQVTKARADHKKLDDQISILSAREPNIAKFAEVMVEIGASVGFLTSANVGWPDAYPIAETAKSISDMIGNVVGSLDGAVGAAEEMKGFIDDMRD